MLVSIVVFVLVGNAYLFWQKSQLPKVEVKAFLITTRATETTQAIKLGDFSKFSTYVHPQKGVRFSPYTYVNLEKDLLFSVDKIKTASEDKTKYTWGVYDGIGTPITLTFNEYFKRFVYSHDFINAPEISYNRTLGKGNTINNISVVYPNSAVVEYHFPEFDPKFGGMDWESLRLVFEELNANWYLVGVVHDEWTI